MSRVIELSQSKLIEFINCCYGIACEHGFHDETHPVSHFLMLTISEVSEMVEADRKCRRCSLAEFDAIQYADGFSLAFMDAVKDTFEDEMADVCIRLFDLCGACGIVPRLDIGWFDEAIGTLSDASLTTMCYELCKVLSTPDDDSPYDDGTNTCLSFCVGYALRLVMWIAEQYDVDLLRHIDLKMRYNNGRERLHGKKY